MHAQYNGISIDQIKSTLGVDYTNIDFWLFLEVFRIRDYWSGVWYDSSKKQYDHND